MELLPKLSFNFFKDYGKEESPREIYEKLSGYSPNS